MIHLLNIFLVAFLAINALVAFTGVTNSDLPALKLELKHKRDIGQFFLTPNRGYDKAHESAKRDKFCLCQMDYRASGDDGKIHSFNAMCYMDLQASVFYFTERNVAERWRTPGWLTVYPVVTKAENSIAPLYRCRNVELLGTTTIFGSGLHQLHLMPDYSVFDFLGGRSNAFNLLVREGNAIARFDYMFPYLLFKNSRLMQANQKQVATSIVDSIPDKNEFPGYAFFQLDRQESGILHYSVFSEDTRVYIDIFGLVDKVMDIGRSYTGVMATDLLAVTFHSESQNFNLLHAPRKMNIELGRRVVFNDRGDYFDATGADPMENLRRYARIRAEAGKIEDIKLISDLTQVYIGLESLQYREVEGTSRTAGTTHAAKTVAARLDFNGTIVVPDFHSDILEAAECAAEMFEADNPQKKLYQSSNVVFSNFAKLESASAGGSKILVPDWRLSGAFNSVDISKNLRLRLRCRIKNGVIKLSNIVEVPSYF